MKLSIRKITAIGRTYRGFKRYQTILGVLLKYGFGDLLESLTPRWTRRRGKSDRVSLTLAEKVRAAIEELGPTFIKLGQILSTRPDLVPLSLAEELAKLQDRAPFFPYEEVQRIVREDLGDAPENLFASFDRAPLAAASIGQVHVAVLKDGTEVVVKCRRPGIRKIVEVDLEIMMFLAETLENRLEELANQKPSAIVEEFARNLEKELDYRTEAGHLRRFAEQFADDPTIKVPRFFPELSSERVLTMERVRGEKVSDIDALKAAGLDPRLIAQRGAAALLRQVFEFGFFHADPHPGNLFVLENNVLCFIDLGMVGRVSRRERQIFANLLTRLAARDETQMVSLTLKLTYFEGQPDREKLERDIGELADERLFKTVGELDVGAFFHDLTHILANHHLRLKPNLFLMIKAIVTMEKFGRALDPDLKMLEMVRPYVQGVLRERFRPSKLLLDFVDPAYDLVELLKELPGDSRSVLKQVREGRFSIGFEHHGLRPLLNTLYSVCDRLVFAIVLASLVVGNSLLVAAPAPQHLRYLGFVGFAISGALGFWLLITMLLGRRS